MHKRKNSGRDPASLHGTYPEYYSKCFGDADFDADYVALSQLRFNPPHRSAADLLRQLTLDDGAVDDLL
ncbi:hypothetical protein HMSSN139_43930 [Paenibacillus sp. HMSSN-139]|nr:hypothetical protein HMSSN139_43930 [Paenibacillus sp. HMSSN-139]